MIVDGSFIEYGSGFDKNNINMADIQNALKYLSQSDKEHAYFMVGIYDNNQDNDVSLEYSINGTLCYIQGEQEMNIDNIAPEESTGYFYLLLQGQIDDLAKKILSTN